MNRLSRNDRKWLEDKFGGRANFDPTERLLYGHDIAAMPSLFKPVIGRTVPDAVVQPESEAELVELVKWAAERNIPLVPRGKISTSSPTLKEPRGSSAKSRSVCKSSANWV